jgi:hypothetical protein
MGRNPFWKSFPERGAAGMRPPKRSVRVPLPQGCFFAGGGAAGLDAGADDAGAFFTG